MSRVIHFEIHADDPERAVKFFQKVFGWQIQKWEGPTEYWLIKTGDAPEPGIDGAIMRRTNQGTTYNTVSVASVEEYSRKVEQAGGKIIAPKMAIPGIGYFAYCTDTEGNVFGILEPDMAAK